MMICMASLFLSFYAICGEQKSVNLVQTGWTPQVKAQLESVLQKGAHQQNVVVFDLDNTLLCRDIGEATAAVLVKSGLVKNSSVPTAISPTFKVGAKEVSLRRSQDPLDYYELLGQATSHHMSDTTPVVESYVWLVQMMAGLKASQVVSATQKAYDNGLAVQDMSTDKQTSIALGRNRTLVYRPFFYPQMVELVSVLIQNGYDVWVVSASNPWSVRWMVTKILNPKVLELGAPEGIKPEHVVGLATLLKGDDNKLYKDSSLVKENKAYAQMEKKELSRYTLTTTPVFPVSSFEGKVANIIKLVGKKPYLIAGDSQNDFAMLGYAKYKLFIGRLERESILRSVRKTSQGRKSDRWMIQPVLHEKKPGFISSLEMLASKMKESQTLKRMFELVT